MPSSAFDLQRWQQELGSFETLAAMTRGGSYNFDSNDGRAEPIRGAEVTASTFNILRVPPLLGRPLLPADEVLGAPNVGVMHATFQFPIRDNVSLPLRLSALSQEYGQGRIVTVFGRRVVSGHSRCWRCSYWWSPVPTSEC